MANETRHAEPNAALGDQLAKDSNALETSKADTAELSPALPAEKADLAVTEKSLTAVEVSRSKCKGCAQMPSNLEVSMAACVRS